VSKSGKPHILISFKIPKVFCFFNESKKLMFTASPQLNVTLICGPTDMRKAIDGLCNIVAYDLEKEPCT
jgi:hypothetical protein